MILICKGIVMNVIIINWVEIKPLKNDYITEDTSKNITKYRWYVRWVLKYIKENTNINKEKFKEIVENIFTNDGGREKEWKELWISIWLNYSTNALKKQTIRFINEVNKYWAWIYEFIWDWKDSELESIDNIQKDKKNTINWDGIKQLKTIIENFIKNSLKNKPNQKVKDYTIKYEWFTTQASFWKWSIADITWLAFLKDWNEVSKGIYPCLLFNRKTKTLVVSYWVSETNKPDLDWWNIWKNKIWEELSWERYKDSFIQRAYEIKNGKKLPIEEIIKDIDTVIDKYETPKLKISDIIGEIKKNQVISDEQIYNILIALKISNFLIFSWSSWTWKTSIVEKLSNVLNWKSLKFSIKSNFTDESWLLWYWNPLLSKYEWTEVLKFLINTSKDKENLYFLLLDEMNLSKVENYFSTFLSEIDKLDDKPKILLFETVIRNIRQYENIKHFLIEYFWENEYKDFIEFDKDNDFIEYYKELIKNVDKDSNFKPKDIWFIKVYLKLTPNLKIIWTINEDETTNAISNKVLDRSQFITFEVGDLFWEEENNLNNDFLGLKNNYFDDFYNIKLKLKSTDENENEKDLNKYFENLDDFKNIKKILKELNKQIRQISLNESIWYRTIEEMLTYIKNYCAYDGKSKNIDLDYLYQALDNQIAQKVLPKLKIFNLISDEQKQAFGRIWEILEWGQIKIENSETDNSEIEFPKLEKSLKFYEHLKNNLLE